VVDANDKAYLSITAHAAVLNDSALAANYWKKTDDVWWPDGPRDRNARVLRLDPQRAELWDGPASSVVAAYEFTKAKVTGEKPDLGENRKATVEM
jgi:general stress protein 26